MPNTNKLKKNQTNSEYYHRNKERILSKLREDWPTYYMDNKERLKQQAIRYREKNYEFHLYRLIRNRCKEKKIEFTINVEDIIIPEVCPYLKIPLTRTQGHGVVWTNASVDRVDPSKGYTKENIQVISKKANLMKAHATQEELLQFAKSILERGY